jgi:hypothetical protein
LFTVAVDLQLELSAISFELARPSAQPYETVADESAEEPQRVDTKRRHGGHNREIEP